VLAVPSAALIFAWFFGVLRHCCFHNCLCIHRFFSCLRSRRFSFLRSRRSSFCLFSRFRSRCSCFCLFSRFCSRRLSLFSCLRRRLSFLSCLRYRCRFGCLFGYPQLPAVAQLKPFLGTA